jgi:hypothetical protein
MRRSELILIISTLVTSGVPALAQQQQAPRPIQQQVRQATPQPAPPTGPNPAADITRYGARAVATNTAPAIPGITAKMNSSSKSATVSNASTLRNGDGVTIFGAGAAHGMKTPGAPTVTQSVAKAMTGTGIVATGPAGATTYNYQVIARNKAGGLTAASSVGATTTGQAALGSQTVSITSISKSGNVNTVTTSSAHGLSAFSQVNIFQTSDDTNFAGNFVVLTVPDTTHFTYQNNFDTTNGAPTSATGGTVKWYNCNRVSWTAVTGAWVYYIYGRTGRSLTYLGVSKPSQLYFDDFGSPMMDNVVKPYFVPDTPPGSALNNPLVTTIASGAGTTTLTLANAAGTTVLGATILFDNTPAIQAAAATQAQTGLGGSLYFPVIPVGGGSFVTNSYLTIPSITGLSYSGGLFLNDTMESGSGSRWSGSVVLLRAGAPSFAFEGLSTITAGRAPLAIFAPNGGTFRNLQITAASNGIGMLVNGANQSTWENMTFTSTSGSNDYMSQGLVGLSVTDIFFNTLNNITFLGTQGVNTMTPLMYFNCSGGMKIRNVSMSGRGISWGAINNSTVEINNGRVQGTFNMPAFTVGGMATTGPDICPGTLSVGLSGSGPLTFHNFEIDTSAQSLVANLPWNGVRPNSGQLTVDNSGYPSFNGVGIPPNVTGAPFFSVLGIGSAGTIGNTFATTVSGAGLLANGSATAVMARGTGNVSNGFGMATPAAPTVSVSGAGTRSAGTYVYYFYAVDAFPNGGGGGTGPGNAVSPLSNPSTPITLDGKQAVQLNWKLVPGQVTTIICASKNGGSISCPDMGPGYRISGTSFLDTGNIGFTASANQAGLTGMSSGANSLGFETYNFILTGGGFKSAEAGTFTANRTWTRPDATGTAAAINVAQTWSATQTNMALENPAITTGTSTSLALTTPAIGGETISASPRSEQNVFLPGTLTSIWTGSTWTTDKAVTITRLQVQAKTAPAGCTTNAIVRLTDGTTPVNITISAATNDSGAISQNYAAASSLQVLVQTAAAGCTTSPADANVTVQYRMQ